ncbi:hypothetical protein [Isoptericola sp. BMS4]|uniref:hypothetical protein n=1 Tax=Isoptericola sp. BMS4 TaxID=2527875 RepID=UPI001420F626|nr:hypothetical protein [Isoptericola sp. BMS4]
MRTPRLHALARVVTLVALVLAVADGFRWGNRWYLSTAFGDAGSPGHAADLLASAHGALLHGLGWLALAVAAGAVGWQLRVVRRQGA